MQSGRGRCFFKKEGECRGDLTVQQIFFFLFLKAFFNIFVSEQLFLMNTRFLWVNIFQFEQICSAKLRTKHTIIHFLHPLVYGGCLVLRETGLCCRDDHYINDTFVSFVCLKTQYNLIVLLCIFSIHPFALDV